MIRAATSADLDGIVAVKEALTVSESQWRRGGRGFLLRHPREEYEAQVAQGVVRVATGPDGAVVGFAVALPDPVLRASALWELARGVRWDGVDPAQHDGEKIAFFDQLGVLPVAGRSRHAMDLALGTAAALFGGGHHKILAVATVEPFRNDAAVPFLRRAGARRIGVLPFEDRAAGPLLSDLFCLEREEFVSLLRREAGETSAVRRRLLPLLAIVGASV